MLSAEWHTQTRTTDTENMDSILQLIVQQLRELRSDISAVSAELKSEIIAVRSGQEKMSSEFKTNIPAVEDKISAMQEQIKNDLQEKLSAIKEDLKTYK
jgi:ABC-type molybdenum transport system ATPase subunit/photorepair protein PhrA